MIRFASALNYATAKTLCFSHRNKILLSLESYFFDIKSWGELSGKQIQVEPGNRKTQKD